MGVLVVIGVYVALERAEDVGAVSFESVVDVVPVVAVLAGDEVAVLSVAGALSEVAVLTPEVDVVEVRVVPLARLRWLVVVTVGEVIAALCFALRFCFSVVRRFPACASGPKPTTSPSVIRTKSVLCITTFAALSIIRSLSLVSRFVRGISSPRVDPDLPVDAQYRQPHDCPLVLVT